MISLTETEQLIEEDAVPWQASLDLLGGEMASPNPGGPTTTSVPLRESPALPLFPNEHENPPNWPEIRRSPRFTPYEEGIRNSDRPLGQNGGEFGFLVLMLSGVQVVSTYNNIWRSTVGQAADRVFKYKLGGHW